LFVCLFISFVFPFYLFIVYVMWLYFIIFSLKVYLALKRDYHILFVYWLIFVLEKQQTKERTQNTKIYQTWKNNDVFPLTQATLIKNEFMTLIFEQALQKKVVWVCFDVLFFISESHFLFLLIFILFWFACIYLCCWCFPLCAL
jgi:hypothetical protein